MKRLLSVLSIFVIASPMVAMSRLSTPVIRQAALQPTKIVPQKAILVRNCNTKNVAIKALCAGAVVTTAYSAAHLNKYVAQDHIIEMPDISFEDSYNPNELLSLFAKAKNDLSTGTVFVILKNNPGGLETLGNQAIQEIESIKSRNKRIVAIVLEQAASAGFKFASSADCIIARKHAQFGGVGVCSVAQTFTGYIIGTSGSSKIPETKIEIFLNNNPYSIFMVYDIINKNLSTYATPLSQDDKAMLHKAMLVINQAIKGHKKFIEHITKNRLQHPNFESEHFKHWHNAQIFSAEKAFTYGLVDHVVKSDATAEEIIQAYNKGEKGLQAIAK